MSDASGSGSGSDDDQVSDIRAFKQQGNGCFQSKNYVTAIKYYSDGISHSIFKVDNASQSISLQLLKLKQALLLNRAKCYYAQNEYECALSDVSECSNTLPNSKLSFKALFTQAEILKKIKNYKNAIQACNRIIQANKHACDLRTKQRAKSLKSQIKDEIIKHKSQHIAKQSHKKTMNTLTLSIGQQRQQIAQLMQSDLSTAMDMLAGTATHNANTASNSNANTNTNSNEISMGFFWIISHKWWLKWQAIPDNTQLANGDSHLLSILTVDCRHLVVHDDSAHSTNNKHKNKNKNKSIDTGSGSAPPPPTTTVIDVPTIYLYEQALKPNLQRNQDYILISKPVFQQFRDMGYRLVPELLSKKVLYYDARTRKMREDFEIYKSRFLVYFAAQTPHALSSSLLNHNHDDNNIDNNHNNNHTITLHAHPNSSASTAQKQAHAVPSVELVTSLLENVRKIKTCIARHFIIQASSIRLRRGRAQSGDILDESHTLSQLQLHRDGCLYVEVRMPNGCWPSKEPLSKYQTSAPRKKVNILSPKSNQITEVNSEHKTEESLIAVMKELNIEMKDSHSNRSSNATTAAAAQRSPSYHNHHHGGGGGRSSPRQRSSHHRSNSKSKSQSQSTSQRNEMAVAESTDTVASDDSTGTTASASAAEAVCCRTCQRLVRHFIPCGAELNNGEPCSAVYCNIFHRFAHRQFHRREHVRDSSGEYPVMRWGAVGLNNLGNTCYMNSSLQCLSFVSELRSYLVSDDWTEDVNEDNPLGYRGQLAKLFSNFLKHMWFGVSDVYSPQTMRRGIAHLKDTWNSVEQQDAQEFVGWLLDGLHEDLNLIKKKPYQELPDSNGRPDNIVANEHWTLHLRRNQSIIVDLFQGQFKSTLQCPSCDHTSVKFDPFSSISLPIPSKDSQFPVRCLVFSSDLSEAPHRLTVNCSSKASIMQLTQSIGEKLGMNHKQLLMCKVTHSEFRKYWSSGRQLSKVANHTSSKHPAYIYSVECTTIASRKQLNYIQIRMNFRLKPNNKSRIQNGHHHHHNNNNSEEHDNNHNHNNNNNNDSDGSADNDSPFVCFAPPLIMDVPGPLNGQMLYRIFREKFEKRFVKDASDIPSDVPPMPAIKMSLKIDTNEYMPIAIDESAQIPLTNEARNVATINVEFSNREYCRYIDQSRANATKQSSALNDAKPKNYVDIYDCFRLYTGAEVLDEIVWKCSRCRKLAQPSKQLHLWRLPEILILHLKRFSSSMGYFGYGKKIQKLVVFPVYGLDVSKYFSVTNADIPKYDLIGTVNHYGLMQFGHYYACVRTDFSTEITNFYDHFMTVDQPQWRLFNDETVQDIDEQDLYNRYMKHAYLLVYRRRNNTEE